MYIKSAVSHTTVLLAHGWLVASAQKMVSPITDVVILRERACLLGILDFALCLDDTVGHIHHDAYSLCPQPLPVFISLIVHQGLCEALGFSP